MSLFDELFYSGPMLAVFSDANRLQQMLDFESALASAQGQLGLIPQEGAQAISQACRADLLDFVALREGAGRSGNLAIPLVKQLTEQVRAASPDSAGYVHWGATSQDLIDTGMVLQMREAFTLIDSQLQCLNEALVELANQHTNTMMAGRTWLQHAVPITFGWKVAGWLDATLRHQERLRELAQRSLVLQFGGAAGTLASLGSNGGMGAARLSEILGLRVPDVTWHTSRDRIAEIAAALGIITGSLGKMARDISLLMQTEVSEVSEVSGEGRGDSSTMPHKRNPVLCAAVIAASKRMPGLVANILASMDQEQERGLGNWQVEWETLPEIFNLCGGALANAIALIEGLEVHPDRMAANLELTQGLIYAEALSMAISARVGRSAAHALVERLCRLALERKLRLREVLAADGDARTLIAPEDLERLFDPTQYLGDSGSSIDRVVVRASSSGVATKSGWIEHAGVRIYFKLSGPQHLPALVLSNSLGADHTMWDGQLAEFSRHFRIVRYDTRGHGRSSVGPGACTFDLLGRDVIALLDALGVAHCSFCGLSMGGLVGQWLALNASHRIDKLVLSNTAAKIGTHESWNARISAVEAEGMGPIAPAALSRWFTEAYRRSHPGSMLKTQGMIEATPPEGYAACCAALRDADFRNSVKDIRTPTLIIAGTHDPATPVADARFLADTIPDAQFVELNASHLSNMEAANEFNVSSMRFLRG